MKTTQLYTTIFILTFIELSVNDRTTNELQALGFRLCNDSARLLV